MRRHGEAAGEQAAEAAQVPGHAQARPRLGAFRAIAEQHAPVLRTGRREPVLAQAASRAAPKVESPTSSGEAASPPPKAPPVVKKSPASSVKRRAAAEEADLEEEQRVNALLKERIRRLTEAATIDLVSEGARAVLASCAPSAGTQPDSSVHLPSQRARRKRARQVLRSLPRRPRPS